MKNTKIEKTNNNQKFKLDLTDQGPFRREFLGFYITAENGSILKSSQILGLQQAGLSKMIMKLEEELNQKLFTRSQKGVQLTANGQVIFDSLKNTFLFWQQNYNQNSFDRLQIMRSLKIGAHPSISALYFGSFMTPLLNQYPELQIETQFSTSLEVTRLVAELQLDLGFVVNPVKNADLIVKTLREDHVRVWSVKNQKNKILYYNPEMFKGQSLVKKLKSYQLVSIQDYETIVSLVNAGQASGLLPSSLAEKHGLLPQSDKLITVQLALIWQKDRNKVSAFRELSQLILNSFNK